MKPRMISSIGGGATVSEDGVHRYLLWRVLSEEGARANRKLGIFGVNPSTAAHEIEDATTRRIAGFANLWGFGSYELGNEFAYRSKDVEDLARVSIADAIGPLNDVHIVAIMKRCDVVVFAWGPLAKLPERLRKRWQDMVRMADAVGKVPHCIGPCAKDGQPRHPLMLPYTAPLVPWTVPWFPNRVPERGRTLAEQSIALSVEEDGTTLNRTDSYKERQAAYEHRERIDDIRRYKDV